MKKLNTLAAAVAVALGVSVAPHAHALIQLDSAGGGDALLFPVYHGSIDNYFTISNTANAWIQGHLRFRGAGWSSELRDFDVILSPGDVFVFRLADVDGDGLWEIDASLDERNFRYTGILPSSFSQCTSAADGSKRDKCIDSSLALIPDAATLARAMFGNPTEAQSKFAEELRAYNLTVGYVEFIGESVLNGMTRATMEALLTLDNQPAQTRVNSRHGTTAWAWSNAEAGFGSDRGLSDVPNSLTGTAFLSIAGLGVAYNAEALKNFRTMYTNHRVDNYRRVGPTATPVPADANAMMQDSWRAVIVHDENGAITRANGGALGGSPFGAYVYAFNENQQPLEDDTTEGRISFNNTWGPTLADGDDYSLCADNNPYGIEPARNLRAPCGGADSGGADDWDVRLSSNVAWGNTITNSIAEVEEAIRLVGQEFHSYYMDGQPLPNSPDPLMSLYFAYFPTKFYYGENMQNYTSAGSRADYIGRTVFELIRSQKPVTPAVWDINEVALSSRPPTTECISPSTLEECFGAPPGALTFPFELQMLAIGNVKTILNGNAPVQPGVFPAGRVTMMLRGDPMSQPAHVALIANSSWPGLMYTFELGARTMPYITHWRAMHSDMLPNHPAY